MTVEATEQGTDAFPLLTAPLEIRGHRLRNRMMTTAHSIMAPWLPAGSADQYIAYARRRARGGVGLMVVQPIIVDPFHAWPYPVLDRMRALADAIHEEGGTAVIQVVSFGRQIGSAVHLDERAMWSFNGGQDEFGEAVHRMTSAEVQLMVDAHARTAAAAREAGLDGIELHGAHGYLLQQSMSPWGNGRDDAWGEPLAFAREVLAGCRAALGDDGILGYRITSDDDLRPDEGGQTSQELAALAVALVDTGHIDFLDSSVGTRAPFYSQPAVASYRYGDGYELENTAALRRAIGGRVPVVGLGGITDPATAEQALGDGQCDLVGMTRAFISDPDTGLKVAAGQPRRIRRCVRANECVNRRVDGKAVACWHNVEMSREAQFGDLPDPARRKRVLVVGGGPAGLTAAHVAAERNHDVTVWESSDQLGGRLRLVLGTRAAQLMGTITFLAAELDLLGVTVEVGRAATAQDALLFGADEIVVATGASPQIGRTSLAGAGVVSVDAALRDGVDGASVLVLDRIGYNDAGLVVENLAAAGKRVTYVTPFERIVTNAGFTHRLDLVDIFRRSDQVTVLTQRDLSGFEDGWATVIDPDGLVTDRIAADAVVAALHPVPDDGLVAALVEAGATVHTAGDVIAPRGVVTATREATLLAQRF